MIRSIAFSKKGVLKNSENHRRVLLAHDLIKAAKKGYAFVITWLPLLTWVQNIGIAQPIPTQNHQKYQSHSKRERPRKKQSP
jgi:hypothetical protein